MVMWCWFNESDAYQQMGTFEGLSLTSGVFNVFSIAFVLPLFNVVDSVTKVWDVNIFNYLIFDWLELDQNKVQLNE